MIRKFLDKQKAKRAFKRLLSSEDVEKLLREGPDLTQHRHGRIEFIVTFVRGENPADVSKRMSQVLGLASAQGAMFHDIIGALVIVAFGIHPWPTPKEGNRLSLVQLLQQELAADIKIVHGVADGHSGLFGENETPCSHTFLVPQFDQILGKLSRLEFGEVAEFCP
jgi:hypothetical protein